MESLDPGAGVYIVPMNWIVDTVLRLGPFRLRSPGLRTDLVVPPRARVSVHSDRKWNIGREFGDDLTWFKHVEVGDRDVLLANQYVELFKPTQFSFASLINPDELYCGVSGGLSVRQSRNQKKIIGVLHTVQHS